MEYKIFLKNLDASRRALSRAQDRVIMVPKKELDETQRQVVATLSHHLSAARNELEIARRELKAAMKRED